MARIEPKPDVAQDGWRSTGSRWLHTLFQGLERIPQSLHEVRVQISNLNWVYLFDWTSAASLLANRITTRDLDLDLDCSGSDPHVSEFLRSVNTEFELARATKSQVRLTAAGAAPLGKHSQTVLMGLMRIRTDADALRYLDQNRINEWRDAMRERIPSAPLLEHEALWRLLCFELAANIAEHAGDVGFLAAHIIQADTFVPKTDYVSEFRRARGGPFLNLCVSDSGRGLVASLEDAYRARLRIPDHKSVEPGAVVAFAFHEMGSRKDFLETWITDRHALSRCLHLVEQYGGWLRLRTAGFEFRYDLADAAPERATSGLGYLPTTAPIPWAADVPGTHIQVLLPLTPTMQRERKSPLRRVLPSRFTIEDEYPIGHYIPLSAYFNQDDLAEMARFVPAAERLARSIVISRPADEPLVFDLEDLPWGRRQLETFVIMMENVISRRATLLLRLPQSLADELRHDTVVDWHTRRSALLKRIWYAILISLADSATKEEKAALSNTTVESADDEVVRILSRGSLLQQPLLLKRLCEQWQALAAGEISLPRLDIFSEGAVAPTQFDCVPSPNSGGSQFHGAHDVWSTVLALDRSGNPHVLAYEGRQYAEALKSLIFDPATARDLSERARLPMARVEGVLARARPLFDLAENGGWHCCWNEPTLKAQAHRSAVIDFGDVVELTRAWRGRSPFRGSESTAEKYYLPVAHKWLDGFLQCSRILSRERYADEIAQRLIAKLRPFIDDASPLVALVATTTPALILANTLARWLELDKLLVPVLDIGDRVFRGEPLPMQLNGAVILVQDAVSNGRQSSVILEAIRAAGAREIALASYVKLQMSSSSEDHAALFREAKFIALVTTTGPRTTTGHLRDQGAYFVEPRTLHPIPASSFLTPSVEVPLARRQKEPVDLIAWEAQHFEPEQPLIRAGHFIVGHRHHTITIDVRTLATTAIGARIAAEVAAICLGGVKKSKDITMVLMPLDSQVRYLWARVQERLAAANRRQPFAFLEVASVLGDTPTYITPRPLQRQLSLAAIDRAPRRILIFDDAMITGATMHQILMTIQFAAQKVVARHHQASVEFVRCYTAVDRLTRAEHRFASNIRTFGDPSFRVVTQSPVALLGPRPFHEETCPACDELQTVLRVRSSSIGEHSPQVMRWCTGRERELTPEFSQLTTTPTNTERLRPPIVVTDDDPLGALPSADLAITRFQQLMSLSYPVVYVLNRLLVTRDDNVHVGATDANHTASLHHERYRWDVLSWCLRHWSRFVSFPDAGKEAFVATVKNEIATGSRIVPRVLSECAKVAESRQAQEIFAIALREFSQLDAGGLADVGDETFRRAVALETGLLVFFALVRSGYSRTLYQMYEDSVARAAAGDDDEVPNRVGLRRLLMRASGRVRDEPRLFALQSLAETMCRELAPDFQKPSAHDLLPKLLSRLSQGSRTEPISHFSAELLSLFIRAASTLDLYSGFFSDGLPARILASATRLQSELESNAKHLTDISVLAREFEALDETFFTQFSRRFNATMQELRSALEQIRVDRGAAIVPEWIMSDELLATTLLTDATRLRNYVANIVIDPSGKHHMAGSPPRITVRRVTKVTGRDEIELVIVTAFTGSEGRGPSHADNYEFDRDELKHWGVEVDEVAALGEGRLGFRLHVPIGFPR